MKNASNRKFEMIVFSDEWEGLPFSCKHLLRDFLPEVPLTWVETIGLRAPSFSAYDLRRAVDKAVSWLHKPKSRPAQEKNLAIINPIQIPYNQIRWVRNLNKSLMVRSLNPFLSAHPGLRKVVLTTWPFMGNIIGSLGESLSIYYRVDDFSEFPCVDKIRIASFEKELIGKADVIIASADKLAQDIDKNGKVVECIPHGVDYAHFNENGKTGGEMSPVRAIPGPRIGFFGSINSWVDLDLLKIVADDHPEWSFILIGPSQLPESSLPKGNNIHFLGKVDYEELPSYAQYFDVALIPFKVNALTMGVNPLKMMEYFALGLPVVSTPIPEVLKYGEVLRVASDPKAFGEAIRASLIEDGEHARFLRRDVAKRHSWREKSGYLKNLIEECLERKCKSGGFLSSELRPTCDSN